MSQASLGRLPAFQDFIDDLRGVWSSVSGTEARMRAARPLVERFVLVPELRSAAAAWPSTEPRKNLLFYEDAVYGFAINGVVRSANYRGGVHDHAHAWVLYGIIDGTESLERFDRIDDGTKPGFAELRLTGCTNGSRGSVDLVPAFGIHAEQGGPTRSVALIVRSERVAGRMLQSSYDVIGKAVVARDGPEQVPYAL